MEASAYLRAPLIATVQAVDKDWIAASPKYRLVLYQECWMQNQEFIKTIPAKAYCPDCIGSQLF